MAIRTTPGAEVEIVAVIQRYGNGDARVSVRQVGRAHYEIVLASRLQAGGGARELAEALAQSVQARPSFVHSSAVGEQVASYT